MININLFTSLSLMYRLVQFIELVGSSLLNRQKLLILILKDELKNCKKISTLQKCNVLYFT